MGFTDNLTAISLIVAMISVVPQIVQKFGLLLLTLANNWSTGQQQLEDYPQRVRALKQRAKEWELGFKKHGISDIPALASRLTEARKLLEDETDRAKLLDFREQGSSFKRWKRKVASLVFPNELFDRIQRVTDAFAEISGYLEEAGRLRPLLGDFTQGEPAKLPFQKYKCYTANKEVEKLVRDELENKTGVADIVVLNGEPGSGKTCLAKELGLEYEKELYDWKKDQLETESRDLRKDQPTETENRKSDSTKDPPKDPGPTFPDGVFYVDGGSGVDVSQVYKKLLEDLGIAGPRPGPSSCEAQRAEPPPDKDSLRKELEWGLYELSALIIVDNVCDTSILDALIVPKKAGLHRKFLVTTQNANCIRTRGDLRVIKMKSMDHEAATNLLLRKILESDMPESDSKGNAENGVQNTPSLENLICQIKGDIETLKEQMMKDTNCNPQALVCFAELLRDRPVIQERWQELVDLDGEFFNTLENEGIAARAGHSSTVIESMMAPVETLSREQPRALDLLLFLALCESPVPETVLRSISCFLDDKQDIDRKTRFTKKRFSLANSLPVLENWNLIERYFIEAPGNERKPESVLDHSKRSGHEQYFFEVSSLRRKIILKEMGEECQSLIRKLLTTKLPDLSAVSPTEAYLVAVLCAAYGDKTVEELRLGLKEVGLDMEMYNKLRSEFETKRRFVEEALLLLHSSAGVGETKRIDQQKEAHKHGKKVIVQVLCEGTVDDGAISKLLQLCEPFHSIACRAVEVGLTADSLQIVATSSQSAKTEVEISQLSSTERRGEEKEKKILTPEKEAEELGKQKEQRHSSLASSENVLHEAQQTHENQTLKATSDNSWIILDKMREDAESGSIVGGGVREIPMRSLKPTTLLEYMK